MNFLYLASIAEFVDDVKSNRLVPMMEHNARNRHVAIGESEKRSWKINAEALAELFDASFHKDVVIGLEYLVPCGGRVDCALFGVGVDGRKRMAVVELKQWSNEHVTEYYAGHCFHVVVDAYKDGAKVLAHPSAQAGAYVDHILNHVIAMESGDIDVFGCAYCYNYTFNAEAPLCNAIYSKFTDRYPLFCGNQYDELRSKLIGLLGQGGGDDIARTVDNSPIGTTRRLQDAAVHMFDNQALDRQFALIGAQQDAFQYVTAAVEKGHGKTVIIVKGGPGTGKSVIAFRLLAELAGKKPKVFYSTRSASLRKGFRTIFGNAMYDEAGHGAVAGLIKNNIDFRPHEYGENGVDVLIVDEAHRLSDKANDQTDRDHEKQTHLSQISAMLYVARVCVFFIDDMQGVKSYEIGSAAGIYDAASNYKERIDRENASFRHYLEHDIEQEMAKKESKLRELGRSPKWIEDREKELERIKVRKQYGPQWLKDVVPTDCDISIEQFELTDQFRCNGSNNYLDWINYVIYKGSPDYQCRTAAFDPDHYEFGVCDTPQELVKKIRSLDGYAIEADRIKTDEMTFKELQRRIGGKAFNQHARLVAGWCWDWKNDAQDNGDLKAEVTIPQHGFAMPWETKARPRKDFRFKYAIDAEHWANQNEGVNQLGCIYSIQGWETDYVGVIIGPDLDFDAQNDCLRVIPGKTHDVPMDNCDLLVRNIYRVLLTRGKKGCYIFAYNLGVAEYFRQHMNVR